MHAYILPKLLDTKVKVFLLIEIPIPHGDANLVIISVIVLELYGKENGY